MRIISGKLARRKLLDSSFLKDLRPTTDRNRETLFNILISGNFLKNLNLNLEDCHVLDLCCGSGAVGLEFLSRGAKILTLIDNNKLHLTIAKQNAELLGVSNNCQFINGCVKKLPLCNDQYQIIFVDPPYQENYQIIIEQLVEKKYLQANTLLIVERKNNYQKKQQKIIRKRHKFLLEKPKENLEEIIANPIDYRKFSLKILDSKISGSTVFDFLKIS